MNRIHDWEYLQSAQKESNQSLIEYMLLLGELASKEGVGEEDKIVFEILIMIADEVVALFFRFGSNQ